MSDIRLVKKSNNKQKNITGFGVNANGVKRIAEDIESDYKKLSEYVTRRSEGKYISSDEINSYRQAADRYQNNRNRYNSVVGGFSKSYDPKAEKEHSDWISGVLSDMDSSYDFFSKFKTEDEYKKWDVENTRLQNYGGKSYSELNDILYVMPEGEEKEWLKNYAPSVMTAEDYEREIASIDDEIGGLENVLGQYDEMTRIPSKGQYYESWLRDFGNKYGSKDAVEEKIEELKASKWDYENKKKYNLIPQNEDFDANSKYVSTKYDDGFSFDKIFNNAYGLGYGDATYEYVNNVDDFRSVYNDKQAEVERGKLSVESLYEQRGYDHLKKDEIAIYNYLYSTEGAEVAQEYLDSMEIELGKRRTDAKKIEAAQYANEHPVLSSIASVPLNLMSGAGIVDVAFQNLVKNIKEAVTGEYAGPINYNTSNMDYSNMSSTYRGTVAQNIADNTGVINLKEDKHPILSKLLNGKSLGDVYQLGMSMADSATVALMSPVVGTAGTALLGGSAATQGMLNAVEAGATDEQALWMGVLSGGFEMLFEKYELEHLLGADTNVLKAILNQALTEGVGEGATTIANTLTDVLVMAENSQWQKNINEYIANGYSPEDAEKQAFWDAVIQVGWDTVGGMLSGGVMGGGMSALGAIAANAEKNAFYESAGQSVIEKGNLDPLVTQAQALGDKKVSKLAGKVSGVDTANYSERQHTKYNRQVGRLYDRVTNVQQKRALNSNKDTFKASVKRALEEKGVKDVDKATKAIYKAMYTGSLTSADIKIISEVDGKAVMTQVLNSKEFGADTATAKQVAVEDYFKTIELATVKSDAKVMAEAVEDKVSSTSKTVNAETGKEIAIRKIKSIDNGRMVFELDDGSTIDSENVEYKSSDEALIYESVVSMGYDVQTANAIISGYNALDGVSASNYILGMNEAYKYGKIGYPTDRITTNGFYNELTDAQKTFAYNLGRSSANAETKAALDRLNNAKKANAARKGKVHLTASVSSMTERQKASVAALGRVVTDITHNDVYIYESVEKNGKRVFAEDIAGHKAGENAPNGFYDPGTGAIYIDLHAGNNGEGVILWTAAHELTHFVRQWSPEKFKVLADFLMEEYGKKGVDIQALIQAQMNKAKASGRKISFDEAYEEVVADSLQQMFTDTNLAEKLAKLKTQDKTLWEKIKEFFADLYKKITELYQGLDPQTTEAKLVSEMKDSLEAISNLFAEAIADAGDTFAAAETTRLENGIEVVEPNKPKAMCSGRNFVEDKYYSRQIDKFNTLKQGGYITVGKINQGSPLDKIGIPSGSLYFDVSKILKEMRDRKDAIPPDKMKEIPKVLDNPIVITEYVDKNGVHSANVYGNLYIGSSPLVIGVMIAKTQKGNVVSKVQTVHPNRNVMQEMQDDNILYLSENKKETKLWFQSLGTQKLPLGGNKFGFIRSISQKEGTVKKLFSERNKAQLDRDYMSAVESGDMEMAQRMVDEAARKAGYTVKAYHGTPIKGFTVFDDAKIGSTTDDGLFGHGHYFTTNKLTADGYATTDGKTMPVYLRVKKPWWGVGHKVEEVAEQLDLSENMLTLRKVGKHSSVVAPISKFSRTFTAHLIENDYDSVVVQHSRNDYEVVMFDNTRIKSADVVTYDDNGNVIPLSKRFNSKNEDIRYSNRTFSYDELVAKDDLTGKTIKKEQQVPLTKDGGINLAEILDTVKAKCSTIQTNSKSLTYYVNVPDIDTNVEITRDGIKHGFFKGINNKDGITNTVLINARISLELPDILKGAIEVNRSNRDNSQSVAFSSILIGIARIQRDNSETDYDYYAVRFVVLNKTDGSKILKEANILGSLKAANAKKIGQHNAKEVSNATSRTQRDLFVYSVADLLNDVKSEFVGTFSEDVYQHLGTQRKNEKGFTEHLLFSERNPDATDSRTLLANALESATTNEAEKEWLGKYKAQITSLNKDQAELTKINSEIKNIRFTKGADRSGLAALENKAKILANRISKADKKLLKFEASKPLKSVLEREKAAAVKKAKEKNAEALKEYREKSEAKLTALKEKNAESRKNASDRRKASAIKEKIKSFKARLEKSLLNPTDRVYVPLSLINAMVDVCDLIDTDTDLYKADGSINKAQEKRNLTKERLQALKDEYEALKDHNDPTYSGEYDEVIYKYLTKLLNDFGDKSLADMSLEELTDMYETLKSIEGTLQDARKLIGRADAKDIYEAADSIIAEQADITKKRKNGKRNAAQKAKDNVINLSLSPVRNVERMSGYNQGSELVRLFNDFEKGVRKKNLFAMKAYKAFEALTTGKNEKLYDDAIYKEYGTKRYTDVNGRKFGISKMQMMQAILSYEREQANNMHHIAGSGFAFADMDMLRKGKLRDAVSEEYSHRMPFAIDMVEDFKLALANDKWAQDYMQAARQFFNVTAKDAINETYLTLKHRILARDKSYIPFEVDKNFVVREISAQNDIQQTINSYGMLQETKQGASQPIIITGLNNILDRHIDQVGNIQGLAIPIRNFNKVWNVRSVEAGFGDPSVQAAIQRNWGLGGTKHITQTVQDLQGPRVNTQSDLYKKIKSNYIGATFMLNFSVITKQIGSLYSATSMLRWRGPFRMMGNLFYTMVNHKKIAAEVDKYTASAWMRRQGLSDAEIHTLVTESKKPGLLKFLSKINPSKLITAMDHTVALSLWKYAKQDVAKRTGFKGEELLMATAEFYDSVVENTQSMTDVLHRPEIQKRNDVVSEAFGMFKTDLYQMAGQLEVNLGRYTANKSAENGKALGRTAYAVLSSAIWGQLMTTLFALLRYKVDPYRDEEDKDLTFESWMKRQLFSFGGDIMGYIMPLCGSEVVGVFENIMYGESEDIVDSLALTAINDLYNSMITIASKAKEGEPLSADNWKKIITKSLQVFAIPANNVVRIWEAINLHAKDIANGEFFSFEVGAERSPKHHIHRISEAIDAGNEDVALGLFEETVEDIATRKAATDGRDEYSEDDLKEAKSSLKTALGTKYKDGEITKELATKILSTVFEESDDDIYWTIEKWDHADEEDYSKYDNFITAVETGKNLKKTIKQYTDNGVEAKTLASQITSHFKPIYVEMSGSERATLKGYLLNAYEALGYNRSKKAKDIDNWLKD